MKRLLCLAPVLVLGVSATLLLWPASRVQAQTGPIQVISSSATSEFPAGMRFKAQVSGESPITSVAVRLRIGQQTAGAYDYLEMKEGREVDAELLWRTDTSARYIPPGTMITYNFEVEDASGRQLATEQEILIYHDSRLQWQEVSKAPVTVAYHGPVKTRAELVLNTIVGTLEHMGPLLGADYSIPIRVTMYNNVKEMVAGLPPGSSTIRSELITEGQAFPEIGTLIVLGGRLAEGTASHEVTHMLTHRAGNSVFRTVPSWLDEGLAEYGNVASEFSREYDVALQFAVETGRLLPITTLLALPGVPEDVIIFYGEARSIVRFMIDEFGPEKMKQLMAALKASKRIDDALEEVYGLDRVGLENQWREKIGAPHYVPPDTERALPTPISRPAVLPFSLTPQAGAAAIEGTGASPTPTPRPEEVTALQPAVTTPEPEVIEDNAPSAQPPAQGGGGCSRTNGGSRGAMDISGLALLAGLVGLGLRKKLRG